MTRRERLMNALRGQPADRPPVNFYEIGGFRIDRTDPAPFNVYNAPDWAPLLDLAEEQTDLIRMGGPSRKPVDPGMVARIVRERVTEKNGGFARIHCHGRLKNTVSRIAGMGADGLDPIEPPPQGDVELIDVRRAVGRQMTLFGNIEASDIENLAPPAFAVKARRALEQGTAGEGRGFVLMPSASPYGRTISAATLENYRTLVRLAREWG